MHVGHSTSLAAEGKQQAIPHTFVLNDWASIKRYCPALSMLELSALYLQPSGAGHYYRRRLILDRLNLLVGPAVDDIAVRVPAVVDITEKAIWTAFHREVPSL